MAELDTSLFQVFERLRRNGIPLGVSDYLEAIETIRGGMGLEDNDRFKELLRLFWAKSREDQELFDTAFAELVEPQLQIIATPIPRTPTSIAPPPTTTTPQPPPSFPEPQPQLQPQEVQQPQPEKVILPASTVKQSFVLETDFTESPHYYQLTPRLPLNRRDMAGVWRQLRRPQRVGVPEELDVGGTIDNICRTGLLLRPVLQPRRRNLARLLVLMDQQGSMVPFAPLIEAAIESISRGGLLGKIDCYYFHDCPEQFLYQRPTLTNAWPLEEVLQEKAKGNSVLIISDGGAARGYYDGMRVGDTKTFLQTLSTYTYLYAWLNPMPQNRWLTTTAEDIADMVPMFPLEREGLEDVVNILRGHPFPPGVGLEEITPRLVELAQVSSNRTETKIKFRVNQGVNVQRPQTKIIKLLSTADKVAVRNVIRAAYRQIFERDLDPYIINAEFTALESKLSNAEITVKEFIGGLGCSDLYLKEFYAPYPNTKVIELGTKHFLGRAPLNQKEIQKYNQILQTQGLKAFIDAMVNSMEYLQLFGEYTVPYRRFPTLPTANFPDTERLYNKLTKQDSELIVPKFSQLGVEIDE